MNIAMKGINFNSLLVTSKLKHAKTDQEPRELTDMLFGHTFK